MKEQHSKANKQKNIWQIQEAKAKFSQVINEANKRGFQIITKNGEPVIDGLIAATALTYNLTVITENINDFTNTGAKVFNPWLK